MSHSTMRKRWLRPSRTARRRPRLDLERLETRDLLNASAVPTYVLIPHGGGASPFGTGGPTGTTPTQIRHAYGFDQLSYDGTGQTIAIVDAYDDPNIASDLQQFDAKFGLPNPSFTKVNQSGGSTPPAANGGWASEIALDVEWAHVIAPKAAILLVEASSASYTNLLAGVRYAAAQPGVVAVSMSWGGGEFSGETSYDSTFQTPAGHGGVTFIVSSGDSGAPASYPAVAPNVLAVGGTTLNMDSSGNILGESAWSGSGGGLSSQEGQPSYQNGIVTQSSTQRANPDVAYDADPNTGFPVYDSYNNGTAAPWSQFGGTSDAAPQWAGLMALVAQGRGAAGSLDGPSQTLPKLYALSKTNPQDFHDITTGSSTGSPNEPALPGYDLATGLGTPVANLLVPDLVGSQSNPGATHFSVTASPSSLTAGSSTSITVTALDASGNVVTGYTGTVHFTSSDTQAILPPNSTLTNGTGTFSVTLATAGNQTVTATDASVGSITGSTTVTVSAAAASKLAFGQQPGNTAPGSVITPAVTVRVLDQYGNLVTTDNTDQVTVALGSNPGAGTLGGTTTVTVSGGVATFNNLSINNAGNGYTLVASSGALTGATSAAFNVSSAGTVIEGFETSGSWFVTGSGSVTAYRTTRAAHDGTYGLDMYSGNDWLYRSDAAAQVKAGDTLSVWVRFNTSANGRAYFGFGASSAGTLSLVAAPNTGQLILQSNVGYGFTNLAAANQLWQANHWYRLEVDWGSSGTIVGKLFDSNGTTLLRSVTASTTAITSGGIAFRATGNYDKYFDTVTDTYGANNFNGGGSTGGSGGAKHHTLAAFGGASIFDAAFGGLPTGPLSGDKGPRPSAPTGASSTGGAAPADVLFAGNLFGAGEGRRLGQFAPVAEKGPAATPGESFVLGTTGLVTLKFGPATESSSYTSGGDDGLSERDFWELLGESLDELV